MKKQLFTIAIALIGQLVIAQTVLPPSGQSTYIVTSGQQITIADSQSITFGPGVHIQSGATFTASITSTADDPYTAISMSNENYVFTRDYQTAMSSFTTSGTKEGHVYESIIYFDGLGRPMQQLGIKAAPDKEDIITHMEYDGFGRQEKEWLPYHEPAGTLGTYRGDKASTTRSYYKANYPEDFTSLTNSTANAFSQKDFEPSPLNRVLKQAAPGQDWRLGAGHGIEMEYGTNAASEVRLFHVNTTFSNNTYTPSLAQNGYYTVGDLHKAITYDENHTGTAKDHSAEEFTDKQGMVILKRTYENEVAHDTYYVYDDFGNLTYVIPPKVSTSSVSTTELNELCYQYKYDNRNRLVEKKLPGKGWENIIYNRLDQPIMGQDAVQDGNNQWLFTKYDAFGRVAYTGLDSGNSSSRTSAQGSANNLNVQYESRTTGANNYSGTNVYYTKNAYPTSFDNVYTINYYDTYVDTDGLSVPSTVLNQTTTTNTQGLATVGKVRVLGTNDWITTITGYDQKGRVVYTASKNNYLNTTDIIETELDFGGKVVRTKSTHKRTGNADIVTTDTFTYDHAGRLLRQKQTISGQAEETIADNTYDQLGLLVQKEVGGGLQTIDYGYNVRGWLKNINDPSSLGNDLFSFAINYNTVDHSGTKLYNGNIAETEWRTANTDNNLKWYRYGYDALNRIENAMGSNSDYNLVNVDYDKNGNITVLKREGVGSGLMDDLSYNYHNTEVSNRLQRVHDASGNVEGFDNGASTTTEYVYDQNGNMTSDANKNITGITYNHLNLPTNITIDGGSISYIYDATGIKLKKTVGSAVTDYAGNYVYQNGALQFFNHPEGYVNAGGTGYEYVYQYKDHLGNIRLSYTDNGGNLEIVEESNYYPFGLKHKGYNNNISSFGNDMAQKWKFGGKEYDESLDLETYDFGARNYNPALGRWMNVDPLAEIRNWTTPYNYVQNSPLIRFDPDGLTDFKLNKKTGEVSIIGEANDEPDRLFITRKGNLKTDKKTGKIKNKSINVEKGILKDGQNFKMKDETINVNGEKEASTDEVEEFALALSEELNIEISGMAFGDKNEVSKIVIFKYENNTVDTSENPLVLQTSSMRILSSQGGNRIPEDIKKSLRAIFHFHTHPSASENDGLHEDLNQASRQDKRLRDLTNRSPFGKIQFIIKNKNGRHDFTNEK